MAAVGVTAYGADGLRHRDRVAHVVHRRFRVRRGVAVRVEMSREEECQSEAVRDDEDAHHDQEVSHVGRDSAEHRDVCSSKFL